MPDNENGFAALFEWMESDLGISRDFVEQLLSDSDWTFLLKWQGLLEISANHMLTAHFKEPALEKTFARLEMSNFKAGKLAFITACNLWPERERRFVQVVSEMRNFVVHDIRNFGFTFRGYYEQLTDKKQRLTWQRDLSIALDGGVEWNAKHITAEEMVALSPKTAVHWGCIMILVHSYSAHRLAKFEAALANHWRLLGNMIEKNSPLEAHQESTPKE